MQERDPRSAAGAARRYVLLDRDGTLIVEKHYLSDPGQVELLPDVIEGLKQMRSLGFGLLVVTNQSAVGRGYFDLECLAAIHARLEALLEADGVTVDGILVCPHTPDDRCECRKPRAGLVRAATEAYRFDPSQSVVIGDKACDILLGQGIGAMTILVKTGYGAETAKDAVLCPDYVVEDLVQAAECLRSTAAERSMHE